MSSKSSVVKFGSLSAAVIAVINAPQVIAADAAEKKLETVYVSATRSETAQMPVATQIKVIDSEEIRLSGAKLLSEVLRTQAGIQLSDSDGSGARNVTASIRGLSGTNNVLVLVDGRKLNNPTLAAPSLNTVALKDVERIEIVQGSAGVLYGDQAVGGVINIITRRAAAGETDGSINVTGGSDNLEDYTASISQGFANGLGYRVSAQKRNADNYRGNNQSAYENVLANLRYDFEQGYVFVEGQSIDDDLRYPGSISDEEALLNPRLTNKPNDFGNQETELKRVGGGVDISETWQLLAEYTDRDEDSLSFYDDYTPDNGYFPWLSASNLRIKNITPRLVGNLATGEGTAIITLGYDKTEADYTTQDGFNNIAQDVEGIYGQVVYSLTRQLTLSAGARYASVEDLDRMTSVSHEDDVDVGEVGLNYQFNNDWRVFARYADGFRFANADENGFVLPDVDFLEIQTSKSVEVGTGWQGDEASISYALYQIRLDNEITFDSIAFANINLPDSERRGITIDGYTQLSKEIGIRANYTYTDAEVTAGSYKGKVMPYVSENQFNVGVVFNPLEMLTIVFDTSYQGSRYLSGDEANTQPKVEPVYIFNLNVIWEYHQLEVAGRIKNITDEHYAGLQGYSAFSGARYQYPQPDRNYEISIGYRF